MRRMSKPVAPCKDCGGRYVGCHSECEKYLRFLKLNEEYKAVKYAEVEKDTPTTVYFKRLEKDKKRKRRN